MLEHIIERARAEGFLHFVLAVHYLGPYDRGVFRRRQPLADHDRLSARGRRRSERRVRSRCSNPRPELPFLVSNGDVLSDIRYAELLDFHCRHGAAATMAVRLHEWQHPFGVVRTKGVDIIGFEEKPVTRQPHQRRHLRAGAARLDVLVAGRALRHADLVQPAARAAARTIVYPMHEPWLDVGRVDDLERAHDGTLGAGARIQLQASGLIRSTTQTAMMKKARFNRSVQTASPGQILQEMHDLESASSHHFR